MNKKFKEVWQVWEKAHTGSCAGYALLPAEINSDFESAEEAVAAVKQLKKSYIEKGYGFPLYAILKAIVYED